MKRDRRIAKPSEGTTRTLRVPVPHVCVDQHPLIGFRHLLSSLFIAVL